MDGVVSDYSHKLNLPITFIHEHKDELIDGTLFASIPGGQIVNGTIVYSNASTITRIAAPKSFMARRHHRRRLASTGTRSVLVLRISAGDATNTYSAQQLYNYIFDDLNPFTQPTLVSQYAMLSFGKQIFVPTTYGVMEVPVSMNATGATYAAIRDAALQVVLAKYNVSSITEMADHVMFCIPPGTGNWTSTSSFGSWRSVYNDQWCGYLSGFMREIGNNLGLLVSVVDMIVSFMVCWLWL
jgi:hypothetical protein